MAVKKFLDLTGLKQVWGAILTKESALQSQITEAGGKISEFEQAIADFNSSLETLSDKVDNIPSTAEENVINGITVNGTAVEVNNKIANIIFDIPESSVVGVVDNDPFLAIDDKSGKLKSNIIFGRENVVDSEGKEVDSLVLKGNGQTLFSVAVADFIADGMLDDVKLDGDELKFTFNTTATAAGKTDIKVDLSKYLKAFTPADDSITIDGNTIKVADGVFVKKNDLENEIVSLNKFIQYDEVVSLSSEDINDAFNNPIQ